MRRRFASLLMSVLPAAALFGVLGDGTSEQAQAAPVQACLEGAFCDGFENQSGQKPSGNWSVSFPDCQGTSTAVVDSQVAHGGSKSIRINGDGGYCNHVFVGTKKGMGGDTAHVRFFVRHSTALPAEHVTFLAMHDATDDSDLRMGGQNKALQWNRESDDATLPEQSPAGVELSSPLPVKQWTCVEYAVNGPRGTLRTWVNDKPVKGLVADGVPTHDIDSQWLSGGNWSPSLTDLRIGWESYGSGSDTLWFDDVAVSNARIGCSA